MHTRIFTSSSSSLTQLKLSARLFGNHVISVWFQQHHFVTVVEYLHTLKTKQDDKEACAGMDESSPALCSQAQYIYIEFV